MREAMREAMLLNEEKEQSLWLKNLQSADHYNDWIFEQFCDWLSGTVLEFGCGTGNFTTRIASRVDRVVAVDIEPEYVRLAQQNNTRVTNVEFHCLDVCTHPFSEKFDGIVLLDVLEHIEDDGGVLRQLAALLHPGGRMVIKVPAMPQLYNAMDRAIGHHRRYDRQSLTRVVRQAGLQPQTLWYCNTLGVLGWWWNGAVRQKTCAGEGQVGLFNRLVPVLRACERLLPPGFGLSLYCIATATQHP